MFSINKRIVSIIILIVILFSVGCTSNLQQETSLQSKASFDNISNISDDQTMAVIDTLSSKEYDGRLVGSEGNQKAADYISEYFKVIGLTNPKGLIAYRQPYNQYVVVPRSTPVLQILDREGNVIENYRFLKDFRINAAAPMIKIQGETRGQLVIVETKEELRFSNENLKEKIVLVPNDIRKEVGVENLIRVALDRDLDIKGMIWEYDTNSSDYPYGGFPASPHVSEYIEGGRNIDNEDGPAVFMCDMDTFNDLRGAISKEQEVYMKSDYIVQEVLAENIIGLIEGTDESLKNQFIIITAHFDHVGNNRDGTYNPGALDNASGVAALMEIAKTIKNSKVQPKKSILFIAFNGEEEGCFGSRYYVQKPPYPYDKAIVINMDMVGSAADVPLTIGTMDEKDNTLREELLRYGEELNIDVKKGVITASDHAAFARMGVEAVCLINEDWTNGYHRPEDTIDKVSRNKLRKVIELVLKYIDNNAY